MFNRYLPLFLFFFNDTATTEIYTLSLHDALPISSSSTSTTKRIVLGSDSSSRSSNRCSSSDRKSTRLNSSHRTISYAVFCLKKKTAEHYQRSDTEQSHHSPPHSSHLHILDTCASL